MRRWVRALTKLWERARTEHSTPREIGWSVAAGVFSGCTPFVGLHLWIAVALATVLRVNRLWAALGSRVSFTPALAVIAFCEIELAHRLRTRGWVPLSVRDALAQGRALAGDWIIGCLPVGAALAALLGTAAYGIAERRRRRSR